MSAAILQGVPATTLDTDLWVDLPARQYGRVLAVVQKLGGAILARTVVALKDDSLVNFLYRIDGIGSFGEEFELAKEVSLGGCRVRVLPIERIIASKRHLGRPKDIAHLPLLEQVFALLSKRGRGSRTGKRGGG